ncbi:helix-turn-helix domain-containing protein [Barnesiella viscericola]|uniref:helix-turn-helix domain-containing protein n=1 Tax=Barnesiella viscericola TaxID=397865 RepID=UPI0025A49150|nr:helix-turn-helix domain-containing protein [Barnesiella viscericola]MDM8269872.1 helix-turn-helix domain-containing protein [Barnesiella viscericola]
MKRQSLAYLTKQMEQIRQMVASLQPQTTSDKHRFIEIDEACKITRKAKPTIYTLARKGLIPAYKRGKKLYFYEDELLQWIESGRKQVQSMSLQQQAAEIVHGAKRKPKGGYNF